MTPNKFILSMAFLFLLNIPTPTYGSSTAANKSSVIGVSKTTVRAKASFLSKPLFDIAYGTPVVPLSQQTDWILIQHKKSEGWIHRSAVRNSHYILKEIGRKSGTKSSLYENEISTAGKGFSEDYEQMLKANDGNLNYQDVDNIEKNEIQLKDLIEFSKEAKLKSDLFK